MLMTMALCGIIMSDSDLSEKVGESVYHSILPGKNNQP